MAIFFGDSFTEVLRESVSAQNSELNDFKRHCMGAIQQIQQQAWETDLDISTTNIAGTSGFPDTNHASSAHLIGGSGCFL